MGWVATRTPREAEGRESWERARFGRLRGFMQTRAVMEGARVLQKGEVWRFEGV